MRARPRPRGAWLLVGSLVVAALTGCGDESPRWGAVDDSTCASLDLGRLVEQAFPAASPAEVTADSRRGSTAGPGSSEAVCQARVESTDGGRLAIVVEVSSSGTSGTNSLYGLRDGSELSVAGARVAVAPEPVEGWWEEGVRVMAASTPAPPEAAVVHLVVRDDNLVVSVQISDRRGSGTVQPDVDERLADDVVAAVPDIVSSS